MMNRVRKEDLQVGQPLPWPVYDSRGLLLLRRGYIISSPLQLERLVQQGLYVDRTPPERRVEPPPDPAANSPFKLFDDFQTRLRRICDELRGGNNSAGLPERILRLGRDIQALCAKDADAVLGAVHLLEDGHYTVVQALHAAILVEVFLHTLSISREDRLPILAATLTKDIGMMDIHETLTVSRRHPRTSSGRSSGITRNTARKPSRGSASMTAYGWTRYCTTTSGWTAAAIPTPSRTRTFFSPSGCWRSWIFIAP